MSCSLYRRYFRNTDPATRMDRPADFSYKHDAKHTNFLVVSQSREEDPTDESLLQLISVAVSDQQPGQ